MAASAPKRALFKRPAWASATPAKAPDEDHDFYRHTTTVKDIVAKKAQKREAARRQKRVEETKAEDERRKREEHGSKRRKTEREEGSLSQPRMDVDEGGAEERREGERRNSPAVNGKVDAELSRKNGQETANVIDLGSEEEGADSAAVGHRDPCDDVVELVGAKEKSQSKKKSEYSDDSSDNDSDYTREVKQRAREKERRQKLGPDATKSASPAEHTPSEAIYRSTDSPLTTSHHVLPTRSDLSAHNPPSTLPLAPEDEPIVEILIRSPIPNTRPLVVRRRESQPLREVRLAWCAKQLFNDEFTRTVYFTWRGSKVYDLTTCRNFAIQAQKEKKEKDFLGDDNWDDDGNGARNKTREGETLKIELEAVTTDVIKEIQRQREEEERLKNVEEGAEEDEQLPPEPPKEKKIGIILKGKGLKEVRLKVAPGHLVGKIVQAFRQQAGIPQEKAVYLLFDGERLEAESNVEDAALEDGDCIDVQVR